MNRDDFELASSGYSVQNDRLARSEADRKDNTSCHASAFAGRSARASTCQTRSEEHTSELQSLAYLVCRLLLEKKKKRNAPDNRTSRTKTNIDCASLLRALSYALKIESGRSINDRTRKTVSSGPTIASYINFWR